MEDTFWKLSPSYVSSETSRERTRGRSKGRGRLWLTAIRDTCVPSLAACPGDPSPHTTSSHGTCRCRAVWLVLPPAGDRASEACGALSTSDSCPTAGLRAAVLARLEHLPTTGQSVTRFLWVGRGSPQTARSRHRPPACSWVCREGPFQPVLGVKTEAGKNSLLHREGRTVKGTCVRECRGAGTPAGTSEERCDALWDKTSVVSARQHRQDTDCGRGGRDKGQWPGGPR